jgi:hypothetical protein
VRFVNGSASIATGTWDDAFGRTQYDAHAAPAPHVRVVPTGVIAAVRLTGTMECQEGDGWRQSGLMLAARITF